MSTVAHCSWDAPGANRFTGDPVAAVSNYPLPAPVIADLQSKMRAHRYDDIALITRDEITGNWGSYVDMRSMHFGSGRICSTVSRSKWRDSQAERALIYRSGDYTIAVPTICGNVSLITYVEKRNDNTPAPDSFSAGGEGLRWSPASLWGPVPTWSAGGWSVPAELGTRGTGGREGSDPGGWGGWGGYGPSWTVVSGGGGGGGWVYDPVTNNYSTTYYSTSTVTYITNTLASAIPEAPGSLMLLSGIGALAFMYRRRLHGK